MNRSLVTAVAAVALLGISSFQSAQSADPANQSVQVPGKASYKLAPQEFVDYAHSYVLETGHTLKLRQQVNRYFAQLKGEPEVEIYPQEPGAFVSQSGATLAFKDEGDMVMVTSLNRLQIASTEPQFEGVQIASK